MVSIVGAHHTSTDMDISPAINNKTGKKPKSVSLKQSNDGKLRAFVLLHPEAYHTSMEAGYMVVNWTQCKVYNYTPIICLTVWSHEKRMQK